MKKLGEKGWLGMTWPKEYGGSEGEGVYEYLLNEAPRRARRPADRQGRRHHRQDADPPRQREAQGEFLPEDPAQRGRVRGRLQRAQRRLRRGQHAAQGRARRARRQTAGCSTARRSGPPRPTSPSGTGWARAPTPTTSTTASRLFLVPMDHPASPSEIDTMGGVPMGDERTNEVFFDDVFVPDDYVVGEVNRASSTSRRRSTSSASRCSRSRRSSSASRCCAITCATRRATASRCKDDPIVRQRIAQLATEAEVARVHGPARRAASR